MSIKIVDNIKKWLGFSAVVVLISLVGFIGKGLNYGIDFSGGNLFQLRYETPQDQKIVNGLLNDLSSTIEEVGKNKRKVQVSEGQTVIIRTPEISEEKSAILLDHLKDLGDYKLEKSDKVGSTIGKELKTSAISALLIGGILIVIYITLRFELKFAIAAIIALIHDIIISVGLIAILGYEVNTPFIAAVLTLLGYSINDTIVVFDRIRETSERRKNAPIKEIIDTSINQVMVRSLNTSLTTFLAIVAILVFGGDSLKTFITTLLIGIVAGTYSSIFVASPVVYLLEGKFKGKQKEKKEKVSKEHGVV